MSYIEDLNAITTPSLTDLLYIYQNGSDFKVTNQQLLDLIKTNTVIPLTQAQYDLLPSAEKNNGSIYIITDASITADDVEYSSGVSVKDKLDDMALTVKELVIQLGTSAWYGVYYGEANIQTYIDAYGTCINAMVIDEGHFADLSEHNNRFVATQLIVNINDGNKVYLRVYSPTASDTAGHYVKVRLTFANVSAT